MSRNILHTVPQNISAQSNIRKNHFLYKCVTIYMYINVSIVSCLLYPFFKGNMYFFNFYFILEINNVVLVSGVQQSDSVIHIHVSILFQILFPFRLLQNIEQSSLCYTVGHCWLYVLNIDVCTCQSQTPSLSLPPTLSPW